MRRAGLVVPAIIVMATMSACAADSPNEVPPAPSSSSVSPIIPDLDPSQLNPATPGVVDDITGETYTPQPVPEWDATSRKSVVAAAEAAMRAFARPDLDFEKWWADVQPLLDQKASLDYSYMEPSAIPANEVTGAGVIVDDTSAFVGTVEVPTNAGTYTVILSRAVLPVPLFDDGAVGFGGDGRGICLSGDVAVVIGDAGFSFAVFGDR